MDEKKIRGRPKGSKIAATDFKTHGLYKKQIRACVLRASGMTQIEAYCQSHKVSPEDKAANKGQIEDRVYRFFQKPKVKTYLRQLLAAKLLEDILSRQEWILSLIDDIESARDAKSWPAVMNGQRMVGQALAALREGFVAVKDSAERDKEIIEALAGESTERRKALELIMGSDAVFDPPHLVSDNTKKGP